MARRGHRIGVGIMAVLKPGPLLLQAPKAALAKELLPATQIIAPHLVKNKQYRQPGSLGLGFLFCFGGQRQNAEKNREHRHRPTHPGSQTPGSPHENNTPIKAGRSGLFRDDMVFAVVHHAPTTDYKGRPYPLAAAAKSRCMVARSLTSN